MGGETFDHSIILNKCDYDIWIENFQLITKININQTNDQTNDQTNNQTNNQILTPFRLSNKTTYSDIDFIVSDTDEIINIYVKNFGQPLEIKTINLYEDKYALCTKHLLTKDYIQIDLLKAWDCTSLEITRIYFSYGCANVFFKQLVRIASNININRSNIKLSYLGLFCTNRQINLSKVSHIQLDSNTRLITDPYYLFEYMNLDYEKFSQGFQTEFELLEYIKTSKYYDQIIFNANSKFRHDVKRLESFRNLYNAGLLNVRIN